MFTGKIQLSCILNGSVYARDHFPLFFHCSAWMGRVSIGNYQLNKNDSIPSGFNILCDFHICCMKLLFGTTVFPHYVRWFPPQKPPFIEPFRGDPFPSLSQLCHEKTWQQPWDFRGFGRHFGWIFPWLFPLPVAVTKSRSSSSSRGTKRAACGVLASAARSTGRLRSAGELCLADGLQDLLWNKDPIIEVILVIVN